MSVGVISTDASQQRVESRSGSVVRFIELVLVGIIVSGEVVAVVPDVREAHRHVVSDLTLHLQVPFRDPRGSVIR